MKLVVALVLTAACHSSSNAPSDGAIPADATVYPDASPTYSNAFRFAIVGDTRPANEDDVEGYPTAVITKIWADVQAASPHPDFAISTGDYMFASPSKTPSTVDKQLDAYLRARVQFSNNVFPAMGNHECTGATASNCGPISSDGLTANYNAFMARFMAPIGQTNPYYAFQFAAADGSWTAKLVVIAANAWSAAQSTWLTQALTPTTTYTFVLRHESLDTTETPGVPPSNAIIANFPLTLLVVGHTHTYAHEGSADEVIVGNGGAPLTSGANYGYALIDRLASGAIQLTSYDYDTNAVVDQFSVNADGSPAP